MHRTTIPLQLNENVQIAPMDGNSLFASFTGTSG
jgi:hypothetical protein